ncbi:FAD binding domain-containing protein [Trichophaea hybrida]|nr:FAD binding domain-containing protein [Trichophaea hybrida]
MPVFIEEATEARNTRVNPALLTPLPRLAPPPPVNDGTGDEKYEVVIVGSGPTGITLAVLLARYGITSVLTIDSKPASLPAGQADGLQPRTLEVLQSLDLAHEVLSQGCQMHEVGFWNPSQDGDGIVRTAFVPDVSVPARYPHEVTIHQGRIERILNEDLEKNGNKVQRGWTAASFSVDDDGDAEEFPVKVTMTGGEYNLQRVVRCKFLVGGDGAHSTIRRGMGLKLEGDTTDHIWGVMDAVVNTTFPDIRKRCAIHSSAGSIMIIPRERISNTKALTRIYCQMEDDVTADQDDTPPPSPSFTSDRKLASQARRAKVTLSRIVSQAQKVLSPYTISFTSTDWWAAYQIGQRVAPAFSLPNLRVHIGGDACHTHSPKAGQGMNVSMMDAYNLSWKLAHVLNNLSPISLLSTYQHERLEIARQLIAFDTKFSSMFSGKISSSSSGSGLTHDEFLSVFRTGGGFTSGCGIEYLPSFIVSPNVHNAVKDGKRELGLLWPGRRLLNVRTKRFADAAPRDLQDDFASTGVYRILLLLPTIDKHIVSEYAKRIPELFPEGVLETAIVFPGMKGGRGERWEWLVLEDAYDEVYDTFGVDSCWGAVAVVRPDGVVGMVAGVEDGDLVEEWLRGVLKTVIED